MINAEYLKSISKKAASKNGNLENVLSKLVDESEKGVYFAFFDVLTVETQQELLNRGFAITYTPKNKFEVQW